MTVDLSNIDIQPIEAADLAAIGELHARAFGPGRFARTAYRVREGACAFSKHCRAAWYNGELIGAVTITAVTVGDPGSGDTSDKTSGCHWLLGPLAVRSSDMNKGVAQQLVASALASITTTEPPAATVVLVGDLAYYNRLRFETVPRGHISLPGPVDMTRLLIWRGPDGTRDIPTGAVRLAPTAAAATQD